MASDNALSDARTVIVVAAGAATDAEAAVLAVGLIAVRAAPEAAAAIRDHPRLAAVLVETADLSSEALLRLPEIMAAAEDARVPAIVAFAADQLDGVAGTLLGRDVTLLCAPEPIERTAALALAVMADGTMVRDSSGESARLQRLNEEVARFAATLARLADPQAAEPTRPDPFVGDRSFAFGAMPTDIASSDVRRAIRARRLRDDVFALPGLFEDPGWDILLDLFAAELERRQVSVSSLCIAAAVAPTTALRWIGKLIDAGLLDRRADEFDRRRAFLALTARASTAMRNYMAALRRAGLAIA